MDDLELIFALFNLKKEYKWTNWKVNEWLLTFSESSKCRNLNFIQKSRLEQDYNLSTAFTLGDILS